MPRYGYRVAELVRRDLPFDRLTGVHPDVWLFPDFVAVLLGERRSSLTVVHDITFHGRPQGLAAPHAAYLERQARRAIATSRVATVSAVLGAGTRYLAGGVRGVLLDEGLGGAWQRLRSRTPAQCRTGGEAR